jgi:hypothetical protein
MRLADRAHATVLGEVRTPTDWQKVPAETALRVVYLVDDVGPVIRWLVPGPEVERILGGSLHDHLENGDGRDHARSGWMKKHADGSVKIL